MPRRVKHRKVMRGRLSGIAKGGTSVVFGDFGLAAVEPAWITSRQIEAARRAMTRSVRRGGKIWSSELHLRNRSGLRAESGRS